MCELTQASLVDPIVADRYGNLFNKEGFLKEWITNKHTVKTRFPHIKNPITDLIQVKFEKNTQYSKKDIELPHRGEPGPWICPLRPNIEVNGLHRFSVLEPCGHAFCDETVCVDILDNIPLSRYYLRAFVLPPAATCPLCSAQIQHIIPLVPPKEEVLLLEQGYSQQPESSDSDKKKKKKDHHHRHHSTEKQAKLTPESSKTTTHSHSTDTSDEDAPPLDQTKTRCTS